MKLKQKQNESALVCAARKGSRDALRALLEHNWDWLRGLVHSIVLNAADTDDVLQDICVRLINNIASLREPERFRPWLAILAQRQALRYRMQRAKKAVPLNEELANAQPDQKAIKPFENLEQTEQYQQVLKELGRLPEKYRQVFMLKYTSELTYNQIAEVLDIPLTTVQIRLVRARRMIYNQIIGKDKNKVQER